MDHAEGDSIDTEDVLTPLEETEIDALPLCGHNVLTNDSVFDSPRDMLQDLIRYKGEKRVRFSPYVEEMEQSSFSEDPFDACQSGFLPMSTTTTESSQVPPKPIIQIKPPDLTYSKKRKIAPTYTMSKEEQPSWIRRHHFSLTLTFLFATLLVVVLVPLFLTGRLSFRQSPALNSLQPGATNNTWTSPPLDSSKPSNSSGHNETTHSGLVPQQPFQCFYTNEELRSAVDFFFSAQDLRGLAQVYGWPMSAWCTSNITNMTDLFSVARNPLAAWFNENISHWDVSRVTDFSRAFMGASSFNQDLSRWRIGRAKAADFMFLNASSFDQNLCSWGRRLVASTRGMFKGTACESTEDPDLSVVPPSPLCDVCQSSFNVGTR